MLILSSLSFSVPKNVSATLVGENSDNNEILDNQVLDNQVLDNQVPDNQVLDNVGVPGQPQLYSPADLAETGTVVNFEWTVGDGADNHRILIDNDSDLLSPAENVLYGPLDNTHTSGNLAAGTYTWAVVAMNEAGENWSDMKSFTVLGVENEDRDNRQRMKNPKKVLKPISPMEGEDVYTVPKGSVVKHLLDNSTEIYGPDGKLLLTAQDDEVGMVPTPQGFAKATRVYEVPSGSFVHGVSKGITEVYSADNELILTVVDQTKPETSTPAVPSPGVWVEYTQYEATDQDIGFFGAEWTCPLLPINNEIDDDVVFLFPAIIANGEGEWSGERVIVQPVLEYNNDIGESGNPTWGRCWATIDGDYIISDTVDVSFGDSLKGSITWGADEYCIGFYNESTGDGVGLYTDLRVGLDNQRLYTALEGCNLETVSDLYGTCDFTNMSFMKVIQTEEGIQKEWTHITWTDHVPDYAKEFFGSTNLGVQHEGDDHTRLWTNRDFSVSVSPTSGSVAPGGSTSATVTVTDINFGHTVSLSASGSPLIYCYSGTKYNKYYVYSGTYYNKWWYYKVTYIRTGSTSYFWSDTVLSSIPGVVEFTLIKTEYRSEGSAGTKKFDTYQGSSFKTYNYKDGYIEWSYTGQTGYWNEGSTSSYYTTYQGSSFTTPYKDGYIQWNFVGTSDVATYSFSPDSGTWGFTSTLSISTFSFAPAGTYTITIMGTGSGLTRTCTYTLTVT